MTTRGRTDLGHFHGTAATTEDWSDDGFGGGGAPPFFFAVGLAPRRAPTDAPRRDARACVLTSTPFFPPPVLKRRPKRKRSKSKIWRDLVLYPRRADNIRVRTGMKGPIHTSKHMKSCGVFSVGDSGFGRGRARFIRARARARPNLNRRPRREANSACDVM